MSKETEKIISDKLNSREFAFDERAWAGMETLLDAQQKKRRFGFWWWFSIAGFFILAVFGIACYFLINSQNKGLQSLTDFTKNKASVENNEALLQQNKAWLEKNKASMQHNETSISENKALIAQNKTWLEKNKASMQHNKTLITENKALIAQNKAWLEKNKASMQHNKTLITENKALLAQNEASLQQNNASLEENKALFVENNTNSEEKPALQEAKEVNHASDEADSAKTAEQTLLTDSASLAETAQNPLTAPGKETKNAWGVLAGVGIWKPYQTTLGASTNEGRFGFTGGLYYRRIVHKRWELGLSAIYSSRGALDFDKTYTNTNYGFGIESDKTTVSPKTLHYLNVPFAIRFNATPRSHFYIGAAYYQLLATTSEVTRTIEDSFTSSVVSSEKQTGEHKGFRKNDVAAFIGYELTLFERMNLGLQVSYGFYDITNDSYQKHDDIILKGFDRNITLQLQLKYDLIRH